MSGQSVQQRDDLSELRDLAVGMREAFRRGENVMEYARGRLQRQENLSIATLIAYDLQAGAYVRDALENPERRARWCGQLADIIAPFLPPGGSLLEAGCGEATTLAGVLSSLQHKPTQAMGFDISWSRCAHGRGWLKTKNEDARLFVADLFEIPLEDSSVDVVYTSHSVEPNGGREEAAIRELMRVTRRALVLVEPIFELASPEAQARMTHHGYVKDLKRITDDLGYHVRDYRLLDYYVNPLNPSGLVLLEKQPAGGYEGAEPQWICPLTGSPLTESAEGFFSAMTGFVYPVLNGIPLLRKDHAVIASAFEDMVDR